MYSIYCIYNKDHNKTYIGQTKDLELRLEQHNQGEFEGYTSRFSGMWILIYSEGAQNRQEALIREKQLKSYQGRQFLKQYIPR